MTATNGTDRKKREVVRLGHFHIDRDAFSDAIWNWRWNDRLIVSVAWARLSFCVYGSESDKRYLAFVCHDWRLDVLVNFSAFQWYQLREIAQAVREAKSND